MQKSEKLLSTHDGSSLNLTAFSSELEKPELAVLMLHGFGEFAGAYAALASRFVEKGCTVYCPDLRGHGKTPGKRGVTVSIGHVLGDIEYVSKLIDKEHPQLSKILYGHSMGGNLALNYLLRHDSDNFCCAVVTSPWLAMHKPYPGAAAALLKAAGKILPGYTMKIKTPPGALSSMPGLIKEGVAENLYHGRMGVKTMTDMTEAGQYALNHACKLSVPLLLMSGGDDKMVSLQAIQSFADSSQPYTVHKSFPGQRHQLHSDAAREKVFDAAWGFIVMHTHNI